MEILKTPLHDTSQAKQSLLIKIEAIHCFRYSCKSFILKQLA